MADKPFYAAGRWRFVTRYPWWDDYDDDIPVVVGHYWRQWQDNSNELFHEPPNYWLGKKKNVFCIDFSIGAMWKTRLPQSPFSPEQFRLCAFRLPERVLIFHNGEKVETMVFQG